MKNIYNKLILGNKCIEYIFYTNISKYNWSQYTSCIVCKDLYYSSKYLCFKLKQTQSKNISDYEYKIDYCYKIVIDYKNLNLVPYIIKDIEPYLIIKPTILQISKDKCETFLNELSKFNCFECIIIGKKISAKKYYNLKNMLGVKYVIYRGLCNENMSYLPNNIDTIKIYINYKVTKLFSLPIGIKKIIIEEKFSHKKYIFNLENIKGIKKILYIKDHNEILNLDKFEYQYLAYLTDNDSIDFTNLPLSIKILNLYSGFNKNLEYLPNDLEKIIFDGDFNSNLSNLPSSVKEIHFNNTTYDKINELPCFIEKIYVNFNELQDELISLMKLPIKLKILNINKNTLFSNYFVKRIMDNKTDLKINLIENTNYNVENDIKIFLSP
jgi:hypothetical protein